MTICIAALCDIKQPKIVFCSDRLVTDNNGLTFEQGQPKLMDLTSNCLCMMAGRGAESDSILFSSIKKIKSKFPEDKFPEIKEIVKIVKEEHQKLRVGCISDEILKGRDMNVKEFYNNLKKFPDWLGIMLDNQISNFDFQVNFLIFGFDIKEEVIYPRLYLINESGEEKLLNTIGFGIIDKSKKKARVK